ncbi:MAG: protoporphyrinogen oxidase [Actinomycetota bacterium]|nr:protoporphyrinogen oxidase [Actinomycetota bacterium]MDA8208992.1 protoporphyrinogen oxidase [Actinomycetota bacterium]
MLAVVGGGISGIAAAFELLEQGVSPEELVLVEAQDSMGGKIRSIEMAGKRVEVGPDAFLTRTSAPTDLAAKVGLSEDLVRPRSFSAAIWARGKRHPSPEGIMLGVPVSVGQFVRTSAVLSPLGRLRALLDVVLPKTRLADDATISHLVRSRFGREVDEVLVDPMVGGINAGSTTVLGLRAVAPQLLDAYAKSGARSLARSLVAVVPPRPPAGGRTIPFASFATGLDTLVQAAEAHLLARGVKILKGARVETIGNGRGGLSLQLAGAGRKRGERIAVAGVILAVPAPSAAALLGETARSASAKLQRIDYADVAMTVMRYPKSAFGEPLQGSGLLVPRRFGHLVTAVTFASRKWEHLDLPDSELLRVSAGRFGDRRFAALDDASLQREISAELAEMLDLRQGPAEAATWRWQGALPQYRPFHKELVASIRAELAEAGAVEICGAAYDGVGVPACITSGTEAARRLAARLAG